MYNGTTWWRRSVAWATAPLQAWSRNTRVLVLVGATLLTTMTAMLQLRSMEGILEISDAAQYVAMARHDMTHVSQPFASRPLGAMLAGALAEVSHGTLLRGFLVEGALALLLTFGAIFWIALQTQTPRWMLLAVVTPWSWRPLAQCMALPDVWYAGMLAVLMLLLQNRRWWLSAFWIFPMMLSRESTVVTLLCLLVAWHGVAGWRQRYAAIAAAIAGSSIVAWIARAALPNVEHLPGPIYLFAKLPWNFVRNVLGVLPWSNVNQELCAVPVWKMPLHLGPVTAIGICRYSAGNQRTALWVLLSNFGLLPLLTGFMLWRVRGRISAVWKTATPLFRFATCYGLVTLLMAPLLGAGMLHLLGYAWPLFFVVPSLLLNLERRAMGWTSQIASFGFLMLHLLSCALTVQSNMTRSIFIQIFLWTLGYAVLQHWLPDEQRKLAIRRVNRQE